MDPYSLLPRHEIERYFSIENARDKVAAECSRAPLNAEVCISLPQCCEDHKTPSLNPTPNYTNSLIDI